MNNATINKEHPNISIFKKLDTCNLVESANLFAENFIWHFFNPKLSDIHGNYSGLKGLQGFFNQLEILTSGTFQIDPVSITTLGNELVVTYVKDRMTPENRVMEPDAIIIWRVVDDLIVEAGVSDRLIQDSYRQTI